MRRHCWLPVALVVCGVAPRASADFNCCTTANAGLAGCQLTSQYNSQIDCDAVNALVSAFNVVLQPAVGAALSHLC